MLRIAPFAVGVCRNRFAGLQTPFCVFGNRFAGVKTPFGCVT